jgi:hypothetical protein
VRGASPASQLRQLCRQYVADEPPDWRPPADPAGFLALARRHLLTPLLWGLLRERLAPDDPVGAALRRDGRRSAARRIALEHLAGTLLDGLNAAGVPVLALKGAAVADRYYRDPSHRPMRDLDLLVRRRDVETVLRVAADRGLHRFEDVHGLAFELRFGSALVLTSTPHDDAKPAIDLHWELFGPAQFAVRGTRWLDTAWHQAASAAIAGHPVLVLRPEHAVLHLAAHLAVHHAFGGLLWYCDLGRLLRLSALDWDVVLAGAEELRLRGVLGLVLGAVDHVLGVGPPPDVAKRLLHRTLRRSIARRLIRDRALRLAPMDRFEHVMPLLVMDRSRDCLAALVCRAAPSPAWVTLRYGGRWPLAYARHGGWALGILSRLLGRAAG